MVEAECLSLALALLRRRDALPRCCGAAADIGVGITEFARAEIMCLIMRSIQYSPSYSEL